MKNYIIEKYCEMFDSWCLHLIAPNDEERRNQILQECMEKEPNEKFRISEIEEKDCWWNDPFLCN